MVHHDKKQQENNDRKEKSEHIPGSSPKGEKRLADSQPEDSKLPTKKKQDDGNQKHVVGTQGSIGSRSNLIGDGSSVYAELRARNPSALAASPGSSLQSINSLSKGQDLDIMCDMDVLRQVPIMDSEAQSKQGSNTQSETREKDALEKSTMGTTHGRKQNLTRRKSIMMPHRMQPYKMGNLHHHTSMAPSSLRDSGTRVDIQRVHNTMSAGSAALCQQRHTLQGLVGLNKYYMQTQQHHMKNMSSMVNNMAQVAGEMIKQGHNPSSLNLSAAVRACSLANVIIYRAGCISKPPVITPRGMFTDPRAKSLKDPAFPAPPGPGNVNP